MKKEVKSMEEMEVFANTFLSHISPAETATVVGLSGDLGSGKTTFTKILAKELGIVDHITSPTFVIQKKYNILNHPDFDTLIHIDAYRLEEKGELEVLDWKELTENSKNLILVEWPELVGVDATLNFKYIDETTREITYDI
ncbi:MAG: tRNA threonylcarbamoyladenosine biosynthesis protein TsaE [Candidatus Paceibacteria bacterium]|jgi:tRNA threonylcarbamoyladenosine biosynthesis protein TsaE